ncbi:MAG: acetyl-CoA carboxylase biotin carboxyl carrier protein subunit [Bryobacteraceae bacterium]
MTLRIELDGEEYSLDLRRNAATSEYRLGVQQTEAGGQGIRNSSGTASVIEVMPGVFSVLLSHRSFTVYVVPNGENLEVWTHDQRHIVSIADARDRASKKNKVSAAGPMELRAVMPGKVIKLLVQAGAAVEPGQGLIVVEAMKMQNEMKSLKKGIVSRIHAVEGATVVAGEALIVVE